MRMQRLAGAALAALVLVNASCRPRRPDPRATVNAQLAAREEARWQSAELYRAALDDLRAGQAARARERLARAVRLDDENVYAWMELGAAEFDLDHYYEAAEAFHRASRLAPSRYEPYFNLGSVLEAVGRYEDAVKAYDDALGLAPDEVEVMENLARTLVRARRDPERARMLIDRALGLEFRPEWRQWLQMQAVRMTPDTRPTTREAAPMRDAAPMREAAPMRDTAPHDVTAPGAATRPAEPEGPSRQE